MFSSQKSTFGPYTRYDVADQSGEFQLSFLLERGAMLLQVRLNGMNTLDGYTTPEEVDFNRWAKSGLLFPFPNRLEDGAYTWQGVRYQFDCNDAERHNALHGFAMEYAFELTTESFTEEEALVECRWQYAGDHPAYPFPCDLSVQYRMHREHGFSIAISVTNRFTHPIPVGIGYHPYFVVSDSIDTATLEVPLVQLIGVNERMIPTGKRYDYDLFQVPRPIRSEVLDNCFLLASPSERTTIHLSGERYSLHFWQETARFPYAQLFTHPDRHALAIEPMSCNVNAFNNGDGLLQLAPEASWSGRFGWTAA